MDKRARVFDVRTFLGTTGLAKKLVAFRRSEIIFSQGDSCDRAMYIQEGGVKLSALSKGGRDVVVGMLGPGDFFGEGCLAGQSTRVVTATATAPTTIFMIRNSRMLKVLHQEQ